MFRGLLSVGGFTLLSRLTGFGRDLALSAILGAGAVADAFVVAFRLPNQFRAIFGEGAFNTAYVPSYSRVLASEGDEEAKHFSSQIFTLLLASQVLLLALAWLFTPQLIELLAPGFDADPVVSLDVGWPLHRHLETGVHARTHVLTEMAPRSGSGASLSFPPAFASCSRVKRKPITTPATSRIPNPA